MTHSDSGQSGLPHLRLTPPQIFDLWQSGYYTPKGYLYHLVLAHKKVGWWWRIDNVSEFCRKWDIKRRTFYRAKAALIAEGLFEESIIGSVEVRVVSTFVCDTGDTPVPSEGSSVPSESQRVPDLAQRVSNGSQPSPETVSQQGLQNSPDLIQIFKQLPTTEKVCAPVENFSEEEPNRESIFENRPVVKVENQNLQVDSEKIIAPPILQRAEKLGVKISDRILLEAIKRWPMRLPVALDCLDEKRHTVKHPTRFLQKAIEEDWQPERTSSAPTGFGEWFDEAKRRGLAIASEMRDNVLHIFTVDQRWCPFELLRSMTWDELKARISLAHTHAVDRQAIPILGT